MLGYAGGLAVAGIWAGDFYGPSTLTFDDTGLLTAITPMDDCGTCVTVMPGLVDRHVHLGLVPYRELAESSVTEVYDLGWDPAALERIEVPEVVVHPGGRFHTAPGGYPCGRSWVPNPAIRLVRSAEDAHQAVAEAVTAGAELIKIALHAGMPLLDDGTLRALVDAAHGVKLPAVVHAEGVGQVARAVAAGADALAHTPWTECVSDRILKWGASMTWCSTLTIHSGAKRAIAINNAARHHAIGGRVLYGTDLGNGPLPIGANHEEILALGEVGLEGEDLITSLVGSVRLPVPANRLLVSPSPLPSTAAEVVDWLARSRRLNEATHIVKKGI